MTRRELKQLIRETIEEQMIQELERGKSQVAIDMGNKLNNIIAKITIPELNKKAGIHANEIIKLIDQDQAQLSQLEKNP